ncbi:DoxX family protein [Mycolicibacterium sp. HS_4_1]
MTAPSSTDNTTPSQAPAYRMGTLLVGMGALHFVAPKPFDGIVPEELPGTARFYTYASGVAEVATGAALLLPRTRKLGALAAVALFVSVFPANVNMVRLWWPKGWAARIAALARLPLQVPMVTQALKVYRNSPDAH